MMNLGNRGARPGRAFGFAALGLALLAPTAKAQSPNTPSAAGPAPATKANKASETGKADQTGKAAKTMPTENWKDALKLPIAPMNADRTPVAELLPDLSKRVGIPILADSVVAATPVTFRTGTLTLPELADGIARLIPGTVVRWVAVPAESPIPDADLLAQLCQMQEVTLATQTPTGDTPRRPMLDVAGRRLSPEEAAPLLATLRLKPVLLLSNPGSENLVGKSARLQAEGLRNYMAMSPEQRLRAIEQQIDNLLNMDPETRKALFGQMQSQATAVMKKINALAPEQRAQFFRDLTGGKFDGNVPPAKTPPAGESARQPR
ncbi:MAG: hypothetical protein SFU56_16860 [Capsulimonadales bacterium]|nr:hypothetical protein [Capsulimonadales bacterium]